MIASVSEPPAGLLEAIAQEDADRAEMDGEVINAIAEQLTDEELAALEKYARLTEPFIIKAPVYPDNCPNDTDKRTS